MKIEWGKIFSGVIQGVVTSAIIGIWIFGASISKDISEIKSDNKNYGYRLGEVEDDIKDLKHRKMAAPRPPERKRK